MSFRQSVGPTGTLRLADRLNVEIFPYIINSLLHRALWYAYCSTSEHSLAKGNAVNSKACDVCPASIQSLNEHNVLDVLGKWGTCDDCPRTNALQIAAQQFRLRRPQWWVVNGKMAVPIWVVERLRNRAFALS